MTNAAACSASPRPTSRCPTRCACRPTACTPAGTGGPTASVHPCAINLGRRPTFYEHADHSLLEAHLLDFDGDLYGERARVSFGHFLRSERKFDGIEAIKTQLALDVAHARHLLGAEAQPGQMTDEPASSYTPAMSVGVVAVGDVGRAGSPNSPTSA